MPIFYIKDGAGNFVPVPALQGKQGEKGDPGVYVGTEQPDDAQVWVKPDGEADPILLYEEQELTDEQKAQARANIGAAEEGVLPPATPDTLGGMMVGEGLEVDEDGRISTDMSGRWEHIRTITLDADTAMIDFSTDKDGQPFELEAFRIEMMVRTIDNNPTCSIRINNTLYAASNVSTQYNSAAFRRTFLTYSYDVYGDGHLFMPQSVASTVVGPGGSPASVYVIPQNMRELVNRIRYFLNTGNTKLFAAESTFELYGVRAK